MNDSSPEHYAALALQVKCRAVNRLGSVAEARQSMRDTIEHCAGLIAGSKRFYQTFSGMPIRLVVLPEYFLSSYPMGERVADWQERACITPDGEEYRALGQVARDNDVYLSGNAYEIDPHFPQLYFQVSFIVAPGGETILRYRRLISMFAPTPHDVLDEFLAHYGAEALFPVVDTPLGRLACVASEEILYPEISRAFALRGAEVLCHSSSEVGSPRSTPKNVAKQARAWENMAYVVSANSAGISGIAFPEHSTDGHSQVVDYRGQVLAEANQGESMNGVAGIDIAALRGARARPSMSNPLARQRLELFAQVYGGAGVYPANNLMDGGLVKAPGREHYLEMQRRAIAALRERGIL
jgi:predicted amidohydrolase